ncbi:MAG: SDR family oxidoreductase [Alphaproteobacteria bacterium]|nr:SDR family oxidoreductase [Alphaproteobacteria bacterium]
MLMSLVHELRKAADYPELAQARVLLSGLTSRCGVDIARAFAERSTRLVIRAAEDSVEVDAIAGLLAQCSAELRLYATDDIEDADAAVAFAQGAAQKAFGGLEAVINLVEIHPADLTGRTSQADLEDLVSEKLLAPTLAARVVANRMQLTLTHGSILHVVRAPAPNSQEELMVLEIVRATLAALVRSEASNWAEKGIRINAVAPATGLEAFEQTLLGEPDVAALALYLASQKGRDLTGHLFDTRNAGCR